MGFLDSLTASVSAAGQKISDKTGEIAGIAKLNSQIDADKKKIETALYELGRAYYTQYKDDASQKFANTVTALDNAYADIEKCTSDIRDLKGIQICPKCNAEVQKGQRFCPSCGTEQPLPAEPAKKTCPQCGATVADGVSFCTACGCKLS